jgi:ubiquinone/menaquinone biosynthesis C-methylase UbiE
MKRVVTPELLDTDAGTPGEIAASLSDLRRINRWFGGISTTCGMIERVAAATRRKQFSLLDVASASGDVAHKAQQQLKSAGVTLDITLMDRVPTHLTNGSRKVAGDARALPFRDNSFDLVSCGLFAHHLEPDELIQFVNEGLRVARSAVLINDLIRDPLHLALVYAGLPLFRSHMTHHDAPASVRAAYTRQEMIEMLKQSKAARIEVMWTFLFRMAAIAWTEEGRERRG